MGVEFRLLGSVEGSVGGRAVDLGPARQRCVLAVLLVDVNHVVPAGQLLERVWGDAAPERGRGTLYSYLSRLRQVVADAGNVALTRQSGGYVLTAEPAVVDLHRFRDLAARAQTVGDEEALRLVEQALGLWRGEAFAGLDSPWLNDVRTALHAEREQLESDHVELRLRRGDHSALVAELASRAADRPLDERLAGQLMSALYGSGRRADALVHYQRLRTQLGDELGVDPSPPLRELHQQILTADVTPVAAATMRTPVPRQLPAAPRAFVGRRDELARLTSLVDEADGAVVISAIHGTAGVGKTALAVHWGQHAADRFPDGQLYVDLRGFDPEWPPVDPSDALGQFLRSLGVDPRDIPQSLDERTALFRSTVAGKRVLLVADNAATVDQVRPLLPGSSTCLTLVTSRNQLGGLVAVEGAHSLVLDMLSPAESLALLENILGRARTAAEPDATAELARLCGYLPLALRVAAGLLVLRPKHSIAATVADLQARGRLAGLKLAGDRRTNVQSAFDLSYLALEPDEQRLLRRLGLVPGPDFAVPVAVVLLEAADDEAAHALDRLVAAHLVESPAPGRYRLHDLVRVYARGRCESDESEVDHSAAAARLLEWYLATAQSAGDLLYPYFNMSYDVAASNAFEDTSQAWAWLEAERLNLVAAVDDAARRGMSTVAWQLVDVLRSFLLIRSYFDTWQTVARTGLLAAEKAGDEQGQAAMHLNLAIAYWGLGHNTEYLDHSAQALTLSRAVGWTTGEAKALSNLGNARRGQGDLQQAVRLLEQALPLRRELGAPAGIANDLIILAQTYGEIGDLRRATDCLVEALALAQDAGSVLDQAIALYALGRSYRYLGRRHDAENSYAKGLAYAREIGSGDWEAYNLGALAELAPEREACILVDRALALVDKCARPETEAAVLIMAGNSCVASRPEVARGFYQRALDVARRICARPSEMAALLGLAEADLGQGRPDHARVLADQALTLTRPAGYRLLEGEALTTLARIELARGHGELGVQHATQALAVHRATGHKAGEEETLLLLAGG